jgi:hypothetical protein
MDYSEIPEHPTWHMLTNPKNMTRELKLFINWCLFNHLALPSLFRRRAMDIDGECLFDIPYSKHNARCGRAGKNNMYAGFFTQDEGEDS